MGEGGHLRFRKPGHRQRHGTGANGRKKIVEIFRCGHDDEVLGRLLQNLEERIGRLLNRRHLARTHVFFETYGGKAVVLGRFVPIVRTFVPFVAGAASMTYPRFTFFNVAGSIAWVGLCFGSGYAFGNVPLVKNNFSLVAIGIVVVSLLPMAIELLRARRRGRPLDAV